ncbi:putative glucan endo-1,3-beta-glucosidase A6 [Platanthera guangdongensis]|uniref:Glucan endo-1,3-beta-glucosidase A6 n=1 Tax=Platanthera guangdongensis TaxID=2320717 RepID=A0ABR2MS93_9ASPA
MADLSGQRGHGWGGNWKVPARYIKGVGSWLTLANPGEELAKAEATRRNSRKWQRGGEEEQAASKVPFHGLGVNYGQLGDNLPSPKVSVSLLRSIRAAAVKIYDANPEILRALCGSGVVVSVMVPNGLLPSIGTNQSAADDWVATNIVPFYGSIRLRFLLVGNEILSDFASNSSFWPYLVPSMIRLNRSLRLFSLRGIKISTTHAMDGTSNLYYHDPGSGLTYTNLLDQMLDAVAAAIAAEGFRKVRIGLSETGWPNAGDLDEIGANVHNAAIYNRNLARRVAENRGLRTPAKPDAVIPIFVFALYNENLKPGPGIERHWGLLYPNGTAVYEVDLKGRRPASSYPPLPPATNNEPFKGKLWCVLDTSGTVNVTAVAAALSYACGQGNGTCAEIQPGGNATSPSR